MLTKKLILALVASIGIAAAPMQAATTDTSMKNWKTTSIIFDGGQHLQTMDLVQVGSPARAGNVVVIRQNSNNLLLAEAPDKIEESEGNGSNKKSNIGHALATVGRYALIGLSILAGLWLWNLLFFYDPILGFALFFLGVAMLGFALHN